MKKKLLMLLLVVLVAGVFSAPAFAAGMTIKVSSPVRKVQLKGGKKYKVTVSIKNNTNKAKSVSGFVGINIEWKKNYPYDSAQCNKDFYYESIKPGQTVKKTVVFKDKDWYYPHKAKKYIGHSGFINAFFMDEYDSVESNHIKVKCVKSLKSATASKKKTVKAAKKTKKKYSIKYNLNGGKNNKKNPTSYTGKKKVVLYKPTRKGYEFKGWYTSKSFKKSTKISKIFKGSKGTKTIYAKWATSFGLAVSGDRDADSDAKEISKFFEKNKLYTSNNKFSYFSAKRAPTRKELDDCIKKAFNKSTKHDICYFVYAGHGYARLEGGGNEEEGYYCTALYPLGITVTQPDKKGLTYYAFEDLIDSLNNACKGHVVMVMSTCHSGGFADVVRDKNLSKKFTVIAGCRKKEGLGNKYKSDDIKNGFVSSLVTTWHLVEGDVSFSDLAFYFREAGRKKSGNLVADKNKNKQITVRELGDYLQKNASREDQHPDYCAQDKGRVIAKYK